MTAESESRAQQYEMQSTNVSATESNKSNSTAKRNKAKTKVVKDEQYKDILLFIKNFKGLAIDCERELQVKFDYIETLTLKCIHQWALVNRRRNQRPFYNRRRLLDSYEKQARLSLRSDLLVRMAAEYETNPVRLARELLAEKYGHLKRDQISVLLKRPHTIDDKMLSANVTQCLGSDIEEGPLLDLWRRVIGEEYEVKLKTMAEAAGINFHDEQILRKLGYDKTPDILIYIPLLYKGQLVNWIESKANFGDVKNHLSNVHKQLNSYTNRFGSGIIIYWFGYHEQVPTLPQNGKDIIVLDDFPKPEDLVLLHLDEDAKTNW